MQRAAALPGDRMRIAVFGLGYVGVVSAACLARDGHRVIGVDTNRRKVQLVNDGASPTVEAGLADLLSDAGRGGRLAARADAGAAARLARDGHRVIGVDTNRRKVQLVNDGASPIVEAGLADMLSDAVRGGRLRATADAVAAVTEADLSLVCVGTPGNGNGSLSLE